MNNAKSVSGPVTHPITVTYRLGDPRIIISGEVSVGANSSFSRAVQQPAERFRCTLDYYLEKEGVSVGSSEVGRCPYDSESWPVAGKVLSSYALVDTMNYTLQESDNLLAECFLRTLGEEFPSQSTSDAQTKGLAAVRAILQQNGVDISSFKQDDGSGLSRQNLVSPQAMAQVLRMMLGTPNGSTYRSFLPVRCLLSMCMSLSDSLIGCRREWYTQKSLRRHFCTRNSPSKDRQVSHCLPLAFPALTLNHRHCQWR